MFQLSLVLCCDESYIHDVKPSPLVSTAAMRLSERCLARRKSDVMASGSVCTLGQRVGVASARRLPACCRG